MLTPLSLDTLKTAAVEFAEFLTSHGIDALYGVTDGKAVGTYVEIGFNDYIGDRFEHVRGNAAKALISRRFDWHLPEP